ncbi:MULTISPECIES: LysR substrate-binding domain-containing protein [unclassified Burkholderia]|uniref:LysR substrate-binding domain-containing protein n=1 Tax=unclassified Burkholderia TaxID=2613784 RepID=UPI000F57D8E9|nr:MULTISPECIES: LysR substrate-binding domain-containing protein [unclassified Burkholderia]RQR69827.1 LysR family transcriptional regulator [Burkholderia sp. Bp9012]RQR73320.1 LysR family transcriptional regulator [Burkholderia sp. Bp9011]RQR85180.1 LysR family transcriptional regulator [Burkholderia sp. Bp9010]RQZ40304.1 LysR family transcriptional regulator [Burkholderia sp. Bp9099]
MRDLDIDLVRCFVAVADTRSFTGASKRLCRSQSAVSTRVQRLEELVGVELFTRSSRQVALTAAGEQFLNYAMGLLRLNDEAVGMLGRSSLEGQLRLGIVEYLVPHRLPELLARIRRLMPRVELTVRVALSEALLHAFDAGELDVVVVKELEGRGSPRLFREEKMLWVADQNLEQPSPIVNLCLLTAPCTFRTTAISALNSSGIQWREALTLSSIVGVQSCVGEGLGVSVLCESALASGLVALPQNDSAWPMLPTIRLVTYDRSPNSLTRALIDLLKA